MAQVLTVLGIPQISYGATSTLFKDKNVYPYFLRTVPADDRQARAIVSILKRFGVEYVQVVNSPGQYGEEAAKEFIKLAKVRKICVAQNITLNVDNKLTTENANQAVEMMLRKPQASVVILMIAKDDLNTFLRAVQANKAASVFEFIGSETWADSRDVIVGVGEVAEDSVTFGVETADLPDFDAYLDNMTPDTYDSNPWFGEYYEAIYDCSLNPGSSQYSTQCSQPYRGVARAPGYEQDPYVLYTVNSVFSAALGIHKAIQDVCGETYHGICEKFRRSGERRQMILDAIKEVRFVDETKQNFEFNEDGESNRGYHIYTVKKTLAGDTYFYNNVGSFNDTHQLRASSTFSVDWQSDCAPTGACDECPSLNADQRARYMQRPSPENLNIIGFFDVHFADSDDPLYCGEIDRGLGFQSVLAFFYAIDQINQNVDLLLPLNIKLGGVAIDTCSNSLRVSQDMFNMLHGNGLCDSVSAEDVVDQSSIVLYMPMGNDNSLAVTNVLSNRDTTVLSPSASSVNLENEPYFLSTVPSDSLNAAAMADLIEEMGWSYVHVVKSDTVYGQSGSDSFLSAARSLDDDSGVCVADTLTLTKEATLDDAKDILRMIDQQSGSRVVVMYTTESDSRLLLEAARSLGLRDRFQWVSSGSFSTEGLEDVARGAMFVEIWNVVAKGFVEYVKSLTVAKHGDIPSDWFDEFWQHTFKCRLENSSVVLTQYSRICSSADRLSPGMVVKDPYILQTILATYATAYGLANIEECQDSSASLSTCLAQQSNKNQFIYDGIHGATWSILPGELNNTKNFRFTDEGRGDMGYNIYNYQIEEGAVDKYNLVQIGQWYGDLQLDRGRYTAYDQHGNRLTIKPSSKCPIGVKCTCVNSDDVTGGSASASGKMAVSDVGMSDNFEELWAIIVTALTGVGIIATLCSMVYLVLFYPIRGGTTVLGYLLLFGVLLLYILVFAFILQPNVPVCGIRRFCLGFFYAICFACMLVKVLNNWRAGSYYGDYAPPTYERLSHPCSLFFIAVFIALVQAIIGVQWLTFVKPDTELVFYEDKYIPRCSPEDFHNQELLISCVYVMCLILVTLVFAAITWDVDENHRESRWISFSCCITIGIWLVWGIVSTMTEIKYRDPSIAIALLVNASLILLCLFVRKIYLLNKYQKEIDEEIKSQYSIPPAPKENGLLYTTSYLNEAFDSDTLSRRSHRSHADSGIVYVYNDGTAVREADIQF